ncbi:MAG: caspase family protein, partial [Leptospiraceae bacterium]|nr:caspase family protein [Leptospiraceae bacterium]
ELNKKPDLYVFALGSENYSQSRNGFNRLQYSIDDAEAIAELFQQSGTGKFENVHIKVITDQDITRDTLRGIRATLENTSVDDTAVVFFAGHGMRKETPVNEANRLLRDIYPGGPSTLRYTEPPNLFYYITSQSHKDRPWQNAIPLDMIRQLMDGIPARQKILMIDACNSGEGESTVNTMPSQFAQEQAERQYDHEEVEHPAQTAELNRGEEEEGLTRRGVILRIARSIDQREMAKMFPELRRGTGTIEISASTASQSAYESGSIGNGFFTAAVIEGIRGGKARDENGQITAGGLRKYIFNRVDELSHGRQQPMTTRDIAGRDFAIVGQ